MDIEIVTPAGRKRYLELLFKYLKKQKKDFDIWTLWINTNNQEDIDFCKKLEKENDWIKTITPQINPMGSFSVYHFYKYTCDPNKIYIKIDDDIVWMEQDFIKKIVRFRLENRDNFLVCANTINNAINDHMHQRFGALNIPEIIGYDVFDPNGWKNPSIAFKKHINLINSVVRSDLEKFKFKKIILNIFERYSINCISWFGKDFALFNGEVDIEDEEWLTVIYPKKISKFNVIYGEVLCSHFAFFPQREYLDDINLLDLYKKIEKLYNDENSNDNLRDDLIKEIINVGLYANNKNLTHYYGTKYNEYVKYEIGLWQHPEEFADLCLILKNYKINSFLNIGTFNGYSFKFLSNFLNRYQETKCITVDSINHNPIIDKRFTYLNTTSQDFIAQKFDLVFIDGDHEYSSVRKDYENVGQYAKICVFHDIKDEFCINLSNGGPPKFWNEIKDDLCIELNAEKPLPATMGIGVKFNLDN